VGVQRLSSFGLVDQAVAVGAIQINDFLLDSLQP